MTSKGKEIYNTIKRSLSSTPFSSVSVGSSSFSSGNSRYHGGTNSRWLHPPDLLMNGRAEYLVRMLGQTEVSEAKGTHVIRDAIHAIRFQLQINRGVTGHSGAKLKKVELRISVDSVTIVDYKTKMILHKYPLHRISFCADDKQDKRVFSFIAKTDSTYQFDCFVFLSDKLAEQITLTIGQAFDLAYQKFVENSNKDLAYRKQTIDLRKRVSELETENDALRSQLAAALRNGNKDTLGATAATSITNSELIIEVHPSSNISLPSMSSSRKTSSSTAGDGIRPAAPNVGRKLENLELDHMENIFDDKFDPRANEKKKKNGVTTKDKFDLDPFGDDFLSEVLSLEPRSNTLVSNECGEVHQPTSEDFEQLLSMVDERMLEMRDGFAHGHLSVGDTGDSARDLVSIYDVATHQRPIKGSSPNISAEI